MREVTTEVLNGLCLSAVGRRLDACPPVMVSAAEVQAALFDILGELGQRETATSGLRDEVSVGLLEVWFQSSLPLGHVGPPKMLSPEMRDTARIWVQLAVTAISLMAETSAPYGPVPEGLRGRPLGLAALAIEILEARSPQRLLDRKARETH